MKPTIEPSTTKLAARLHDGCSSRRACILCDVCSRCISMRKAADTDLHDLQAVPEEYQRARRQCRLTVYWGAVAAFGLRYMMGGETTISLIRALGRTVVCRRRGFHGDVSLGEYRTSQKAAKL